MTTQATVATPAPGRACGTCNMCCKVFDIPALEKPAGAWCQNCKPGAGCTIYDARPDQCRAFFCYWMLTPDLTADWKPDKARFVLTIDVNTKFLLAQVDSSQPSAWKRDPYYSQFKRWALAGLHEGRQVIIFNNKAATIVLPDKDVELGEFGPDDRVFVSRRAIVGGFTFDAEKRKVQGQ